MSNKVMVFIIETVLIIIEVNVDEKIVITL